MTVDVLPSGDFWSRLPPDAAADLERRSVRRRFRAGQMLLYRGDPPSGGVLVLLAGRVRVMASGQGHVVTLGFRGPGELVGEQSALDGGPRSADVEAIEDVEAFSVPAERFVDFLESYPPAALMLLRMLSARLRDADAKRLEVLTLTTMQRVAKRLLEAAREDGGVLRVRMAQEQLASYALASPKSVDRALQTMRQLNCIETGRRDITILDRDKLQGLYDMAC